MRRCQPALLLLLPLILGAPASAGCDPTAARGLPGGQAHEVVVTAHPTEGLEVGMPAACWYARAIRLDLKGEWEQSGRAFLKAADEFTAMEGTRPGWEPVVRGWVAKARFQQEQSSTLARYARYKTRHHFSYDRFRQALALHNKWLGIRAFTGRPDADLQRRVTEHYQQSVQSGRRNERAHLSLATFYLQAGLRQRGQREHDLVPASRRRHLPLEEAAYQTAAGNPDAALDLLVDAARSSSNRRVIQASNMFDPLRGDPRFDKLIAERR